MDQHDAASGITSILHRKGPAIRCANDPLHVSPRGPLAIRVRSAGLYVPTTAGCHAWSSPRQAPNPEPAMKACQLVSKALLMIRPGSFSQVELRGLEPLTPCLQNRRRLSDVVAHLGICP